MNEDQVLMQEHLDGLSDEQLKAAMKEAEADLKKASDEEPNSEWHEACFAALCAYAFEAGKRGLRMQPVH